MKNMLVIIKKELKRFFTDRRMLLAMFLPGILIFCFYRLMGNFFQSDVFSSNTENTVYNIAYTDNYNTDKSNAPKLLSVLDQYLVTENAGNTEKPTAISLDKVEEYKTKVKNGEYVLLIEYTDDFENKINTNEVGNSVNIYYNGDNADSENLYQMVTSFVGSAYNNYSVNVKYTEIEGVKVPTPVETNQSESDGSAMATKIIGFVLPMITVSMLYSTVISFCPESISGEKERGTLASILMTPIKRSEYALGKIVALSIVAALSGIVSFLGLIGSLPSLMGGMSLGLSFGQILLLLLIIISTLLLFVGFGVLISAIANTVKEAASYLGPCTMLFMVMSLIPSILGLTSTGLAFVPVLNLSVSISALLANAPNVTLLFTFSIITNLAVTGLFVFLVTRLFNKERFVLGQ